MATRPESGDFTWPEGYDPEYPVTDVELDTMVEVGLIREGTARHYRKRRDDPNRPPLPPPPTEADFMYAHVGGPPPAEDRRTAAASP
jgi:hypothetical protein